MVNDSIDLLPETVHRGHREDDHELGPLFLRVGPLSMVGIFSVSPELLL